MEIKIIAIEKALRLLEASGASFHVKFGENEWGAEVNPQKPKKAFKHPFGADTAHIKPYLQNVEAGQAVSIPFGNIDGNSMCSTITAYLSTHWGNGSYISQRTKNGVEVLRVS